MSCAAFFHVLDAHPLQPGMERVLAGKDVGAGRSHERQPRAVGAAADRASHRRETGAPDCLDGVVDDLGVTVDHLPHVAILLLDLHPPRRARKILHHVFDDAFQQCFLLLQAVIVEIAHDEAERGLFQFALDGDRVYRAETLPCPRWSPASRCVWAAGLR